MPGSLVVLAFRSQRRANLAALGLFALASFLLLGLPVLDAPGPMLSGQGADPELFVWALAWWPHALLHGENPFHSTAIWAPGGVNVMWTSSVPAIAALVSPITLLAGPVAAFEVAVVLMPALSAWTAYLLCRYLTDSFPASLLGGYLFGFSSYELSHDQGGHLHLTSVFLLPVAALLVLRSLDGTLGRRGLAARLALVLAVQIMLSTEIATTLTIAIAVALGLGALVAPARRARLAALLPALLGAYALAAVLSSPFLYYALHGFRGSPPYPQDAFYADLLSFVIPARGSMFAIGSVYHGLPSTLAGVEAYLGLPILVVLVLYARSRAGTPGGRFVILSFIAGVIFALGPFLTIDGRRVGVLPWVIVHDLPGFEDVLTTRFAVYPALAAAVAVALWTSSRPPGALRLLLPALSILALLPTFRADAWAGAYQLPALVTSQGYRSCLDGQNLLELPVGLGDDDLWQARAGFRFDLAGGWLGEWFIPKELLSAPGLTVLSPAGRVTPREAATIRTFVRVHAVSAIVVEPGRAGTLAPALGRLASPHRIGGLVLYQLKPLPRSCFPERSS